MYCPYACPPGMLMAQWDPDATEYKYPQSMVSLNITYRLLPLLYNKADELIMF